ncbi:unnamed protein product, partial [Ectocarpus fasciculatus]
GASSPYVHAATHQRTKSVRYQRVAVPCVTCPRSKHLKNVVSIQIDAATLDGVGTKPEDHDATFLCCVKFPRSRGEQSSAKGVIYQYHGVAPAPRSRRETGDLSACGVYLCCPRIFCCGRVSPCLHKGQRAAYCVPHGHSALIDLPHSWSPAPPYT